MSDKKFSIRRDYFDMGSAGYCSLDWPDEMDEDQLHDFLDWLGLMERKITRIAALPAPPDTGSEK